MLAIVYKLSFFVFSERVSVLFLSVCVLFFFSMDQVVTSEALNSKLF